MPRSRPPGAEARRGRRRAGFGLLLALLPCAALAAVELNRIVLRVNDRIASLEDYRERRDDRRRAIQQAQVPEEQRRELLAIASETTLQELFEELLVLSRADQLGLRVTPEQVTRAIAQMKESFGIENDEQFQAALESSGLTLEELEDQVRRNLLFREVMGREVQARIAVEEEDLRRYYAQHPEEFALPAQIQLQEVVVLESSGIPLEEMVQIASAIRRQLIAGRTLQQAVEEYAGRGLVSDPIDLGWVAIADLDPGLAAAVEDLETGDFSEPVAARGGVHVIAVTGRRDASQRSFREAAPEIEARERERRFEREFRDYLAELADAAYVVVAPPADAAHFRPVMGAGKTIPGLPADASSPFGEAPPAVESPPAEPSATSADPTAGEPPPAT